MSALELSPGDVRTYYATRVPGLRKQGDELRGPCPVHRGKRDSFAVNLETGLACCHSQCNSKGWDVIDLERELCGTDFKTALAEVKRIIGRADNGNGTSPGRTWRGVRRLVENGYRITASYPYESETGELLFVVDRYEKPGAAKVKLVWRAMPDIAGLL